LTPFTCFAKFKRIFKKCRPIKAALKDFGGGFLGGEVSPTSLGVAKGKDSTLIYIGHTAPDDLIRTILKEIRIIKEKSLHLQQEPPPLLQSPNSMKLARG
jgi:hypothetical protein